MLIRNFEKRVEMNFNKKDEMMRLKSHCDIKVMTVTDKSQNCCILLVRYEIRDKNNNDNVNKNKAKIMT